MALHHVAIEGPIGVGKTTVVDRLAERLEARKVLEDWSTNPFLRPFYDGQPGAAFQTELFFLLSRIASSRSFCDRRDAGAADPCWSSPSRSSCTA